MDKSFKYWKQPLTCSAHAPTLLVIASIAVYFVVRVRRNAVDKSFKYKEQPLSHDDLK